MHNYICFKSQYGCLNYSLFWELLWKSVCCGISLFTGYYLVFASLKTYLRAFNCYVIFTLKVFYILLAVTSIVSILFVCLLGPRLVWTDIHLPHVLLLSLPFFFCLLIVLILCSVTTNTLKLCSLFQKYSYSISFENCKITPTFHKHFKITLEVEIC